MSPHRVLSQNSRELLARRLLERRSSASAVAEAFFAEARDAQATADNSDRLDSVSPIGTASEESYALAAGAYETVREIDRALSRIAGGSYGYCEGCDESIPYQRLKALPATTFCVDCRNCTHPRRAVRVPAVEGILTWT